MIKLTVEYAIRKRPANVWYESPEARNLQVGKENIDYADWRILQYFEVALICQAVSRGQFGSSSGQFSDAKMEKFQIFKNNANSLEINKKSEEEWDLEYHQIVPAFNTDFALQKNAITADMQELDIEPFEVNLEASLKFEAIYIICETA